MIYFTLQNFVIYNGCEKLAQPISKANDLLCALMKLNAQQQQVQVILTRLVASVAFSILLWLTPDHFTLANARRFYSSMGDLLATRGLSQHMLR